MPMPERQPDPDDAQRPGTTTDTGSSARNGDSDNGLDAALESSSGPPASKRRRIGLACNSCRVRKSRCDGQRPSCASCLSLGFDCIYEPSESATNVIVRKDYVSDLEQRVCLIEDRLQRVSFLEDRLQRINDVLKGHLSPCLNDSTGPLNLNHHQHHQQHARAALTSSTTLTTTTTAAAATRHANGSTPSASSSAAVPPHTHETCATSLEEPRDEDAHPNGMAMVFIEEQSSAFFGESSNINFTQQLLRAVATVHQGGFPANEAPAPAFGTTHSQPYHPLVSSSSSSSSILLSSSSSTSPVDTLPTALPSVDEMDSLLTIFFDTAGSVFPFIHEPTLRDTYNECRRNGFTRARRTWLGTLNMMFAMAANFDRERTPSARKRYERANVFYKRANELCGDLSRRVISLEIVHYLLLVVIHCQGTQRSVQAWNYHGLVVRSAMALGLHRDPTADRSDFGGGGGGGGSGGTPLGPVQQEAHRRTWVVIYILDKILSTAFGRPASVPDEQIMTRRDLINLDLSRTSTTATTTTTTTTASGSSEAATAATAAATAATDDLPGEFLRVSFTLYHIMGRSLHLQYGANLVNAAASWEVVDGLDSLKASGELRRALQGWAASLPLHMRICEHTGSRVLHHNTPGNHLRVILTLRYYNLGILIHKPLLSATLRHVFLSPSSLSSSSSSADPTATSSGSPPPYLVQLTMAEAHECTRAAHVTIELVHAVITEDATGRNNLGQWFYTLYYGWYFYFFFSFSFFSFFSLFSFFFLISSSSFILLHQPLLRARWVVPHMTSLIDGF